MRVAINTLSRYFNQLLNLAIGFALTPFLLRHLGSESLGLQVIALQALQFCALVSGAFGKGYSRYAAVWHAQGNFQKMNAVLGRGLALNLCLCVLTIVPVSLLIAFPETALGVPGQVAHSARWVLFLVTVGFIFDQLIDVWQALLFVSQRFYVQDIVQIVSRTFAALTVVIAFRVHNPSIITWVAITTLTGMLLKLAALLPIALRSVPEARIRLLLPTGPEFRELLGFSFATLLGSLGFLLYYASDSLVISHFPELGTEKVMIYNLGQRWDPQIRSIVLALAGSLTPVFTVLWAKGNTERFRDLFVKSARHAVLLALLPSTLFFIFSENFLYLWVGPLYATDSAPVLRISMLSVLSSAPAIVAYEALLAVGNVRSVGVVTALGGVLNIVLAYCFVRFCGLGIEGIALATFLSLGGFVCTFIVRSLAGIANISLKSILYHSAVIPLSSGLPLLGAAFALRRLYPPNSWLVLIWEMLVCVVIYAVSAMLIGLSAGDRKAFLEVPRRVLRKLRNGQSQLAPVTSRNCDLA